MSNALIALFVAAAAAAFAYSKLGKRVGYGNAKNVWILVAISFFGSFAMVFIILSTFISLQD